MDNILHLLVFVFVSGVSSLYLRINPQHMDAGTSGAVFRVICSSNEPLTHCQFKWRDIYNNDGPLMDLSEGARTPVATNYSYSGNGLERGDCGININRPPGIQRWIVCCRVRSKNSGWHYAHMTLYAHSLSATRLDISSSQMTVKRGENVSILYNASTPLTSCVFRVPDGSYINLSSPPTSSRFSYYGSGLNNGHCGLSINNVTPSISGFVWCQAGMDGKNEWRSFALIVAEPPSIPVIEVKPTTYSAGVTLTVQCTVTNTLPAANITWYLDSKLIRQDHQNEAYTEPWIWPFQQQTIQQTMTLNLSSDLNGKNITCKIKQADNLPEMQTSYTITFHKEFKVPDSVSLKVTSNMLIEGNVLSANCAVSGSYPLPEISWFLGPKNLTRITQTLNKETYFIAESVSVTVHGEDDGQMLKCVVVQSHSVLPIEKVATIHVEHAPKLVQKMEYFKFKIGSPGVAKIEIISNPKPTSYWTVDNANLEEGSIDTTGCYEAAYLVKSVDTLTCALNNGIPLLFQLFTNKDKWNFVKSNDFELLSFDFNPNFYCVAFLNPNMWVARLYINNVTLRDLKTNFFLNARNKYGEEYFRCSNFNTTEQGEVLDQPQVMLSPHVDYFSIGAWVNATCTVSTNRPVAAIKWLLSNVTLTKGLYNTSFISYSGKHVISQRITVQLGESDDGGQLTCISRNNQTQVNISVMYPPKKLTPTIELYGYEVNKPGIASVEISANPRPVIMWEIGGIVVLEDESAADKRFHAQPALFKARGKWIAKLFITNITQQDVESDIALTARNQAGSRTYHVRLLSSQPPNSNNYQETSSREVAVHSPVTLSAASTDTEENFLSTMGDTHKTTAQFYYSTVTVSADGQHIAVPQEEKVTYANNNIYSYLSIGNSIAIVTLCILGSLGYHLLLRRISQEYQGLDRAPMCLENIYYNQVNHPEREREDCALDSCDSI